MVLDSEKSYKDTKLIKQGKAAIESDFERLAHWIDETYDVKTINIIYDRIDEKTPRLEIILEYKNDMNKFTLDYGYKPEIQQAISAQCRKLLPNRSEKISWLPKFLQKSVLKYDIENIWICYSAFDSIAKSEANNRVPGTAIKALIKKMGRPEVWEIVRSFSTATCFLYTNRQLDEYANNYFKQEITDMYFELVRQYDEFEYFKRHEFIIYFDSKENFDTNYNSNWYYYFK